MFNLISHKEFRYIIKHWITPRMAIPESYFTQYQPLSQDYSFFKKINYLVNVRGNT